MSESTRFRVPFRGLTASRLPQPLHHHFQRATHCEPPAAAMETAHRRHCLAQRALYRNSDHILLAHQSYGHSLRSRLNHLVLSCESKLVVCEFVTVRLVLAIEQSVELACVFVPLLIQQRFVCSANQIGNMNQLTLRVLSQLPTNISMLTAQRLKVIASGVPKSAHRISTRSVLTTVAVTLEMPCRGLRAHC